MKDTPVTRWQMDCHIRTFGNKPKYIIELDQCGDSTDTILYVLDEQTQEYNQAEAKDVLNV